MDVDVPNVRFTAGEGVDLLRVRVKTDHFEPALFEEQKQWQADIPQSDDSDTRCSRPDAFEESVQNLWRFDIRWCRGHLEM